MGIIKGLLTGEYPGTGRMEALTDGVFAIVMTLMVLEFSIPVVAKSVVKTELPHKLLELLPEFYSYVLSFVVLAMFWTGHHSAFHYIKRSDGTLIMINIFFLMLVSLIPFTTSLMAEFILEQIPFVIYMIHIMLVLIIRLVIWTYITGKSRLTDTDINPRLVKWEKLTTIGFIFILLLGIGFTFINTAVVWYAMWVLLALAFVTGGGQPKD